MATPDEHYREAENCLARAEYASVTLYDGEAASYWLARAQVHATLAQTSATSVWGAPRPRLVERPQDPGNDQIKEKRP